MKILTAMYTMRRGGAYDRFMMMLEGLLEKGCLVYCISLTPIQIKHPFYHNHVIGLHSVLKIPFVSKIIFLLLFPLHAIRVGWKEKVDLFVAFGPFYAFLQVIPKKMLRKPMITFIRLDLSLHSHNPSYVCHFKYLDKMVEYIGLIFSDRILAPNMRTEETIKQLLKNRKSTRVDLLFNNIPPHINSSGKDPSLVRKRFQIPNEGKIIVTAGMITPRKNFDFILRCFSQIRRGDLFLLVVGDCSTQSDLQYKTYLENLSQNFGLIKRVIFPGWVEQEELWKIFHASDLFVLASKREGMPNVILEALGCDLPCLGSDIPGIKDILLYDELLFDPLDEKRLANKLRSLFSDCQCFGQIKRLCHERKTAFIFDWKERVFNMVIDLVRS